MDRHGLEVILGSTPTKKGSSLPREGRSSEIRPVLTSGCVRGFWQSFEAVVPVGLPGIAVQRAAQCRHPVRSPHPPPRPRLSHPPTDHLLARPLHQPTADALATAQPPRV